MKKITALLLLATLMFSATACGGATGNSTPEASTSPTPDTDEPEVLEIDNSYTVVCSASATEEEKAYADTLVASLKKIGVTVSIADDSAAPTANEILIGNTSRDATKSAVSGLSEGDFTFAVQSDKESGSKIVLAANSSTGIELAVGYFVSSYIAGKDTVILPLTTSFTHKKKEIKLAGKPLSEFTVYYAEEGIGSNKDIQAAKYVDTATAFVDLLEKATGVRLPIVPDTQKLTSESNAILFGRTSHIDDNKLYTTKFTKLGIGAYAVQLTANGNVALAGTNPCSALAAGEAMVNALLGEREDITALDLSGSKEILRVACVGDSITYGTNSTDPSMQSYPVYLQRMLGYSYYVEKYGAPSHSLIETDTQSFLKHTYFNQSVNTAPDIVIVMLGTNDCRTQKWDDSAYKDWKDPARKEAFLAAGQKLIDAYRAKNSDVQIIFSTCPTVPQDQWLGTDWTQRIMVYGNPAIKEIAGQNNCPVIDIFTYSRNHPEMFEGGDGLHPQNEQYEILAQGVYELSKDIIRK